MYHMLLWLLWQLYSFFRLNRPELFSYIVTYKQYELVSALLDVTLKRILHFAKEKMACSFLLSVAIFFSLIYLSQVRICTKPFVIYKGMLLKMSLDILSLSADV